MKNLIRALFKEKTPKKESHMEMFSLEYRDKLVAEHKLISASIGHLQGDHMARFMHRHQSDPVRGALASMKVRKVELEAQIDVLNDFLTG
jgi:hypothetical protein